MACSACGRSGAEAKRLFKARPGGDSALLLCQPCVDEAAMAIDDAPTRIPGGQHHCSFCGKADDAVAVLVAIGRHKVCEECVDAYRAE